MLRARTGAPARARTALVPIVRSQVLLPDMLEPLTTCSAQTSPSAMSLRTQRSCGISGCPSPVASKWGPWSSISGKGSSGFSYAYENPEDPFPEIDDQGPHFEATGLGHPLIPHDRCVRNDIALGDVCALHVVSGSNMSGKSTWLRTIGTNAVRARAGAPVRARSMKLRPLAVGASLRAQDSLQEGRSRFYAELQCLRRVVDLTAGSLPVLFLLDEVLAGTNSHDRRIGAEALVVQLLERRALGL